MSDGGKESRDDATKPPPPPTAAVAAAAAAAAAAVPRTKRVSFGPDVLLNQKKTGRVVGSDRLKQRKAAKKGQSKSSKTADAQKEGQQQQQQQQQCNKRGPALSEDCALPNPSINPSVETSLERTLTIFGALIAALVVLQSLGVLRILYIITRYTLYALAIIVIILDAPFLYWNAERLRLKRLRDKQQRERKKIGADCELGTKD